MCGSYDDFIVKWCRMNGVHRASSFNGAQNAQAVDLTVKLGSCAPSRDKIPYFKRESEG